jgi:D-alanyl-D-alanine dipeptidase
LGWLIILLFPGGLFSQQIPVSSYGVQVINSVDQYRQMANADSQKRMADLRREIPGIVLDLRYATKNNFTGQRMYPARTYTTYLRWPAANSLKEVQAELKGLGLGLKIFDAYRPYSVTVKFWELVHDPRYVADPSKASGHNRGIAVDLTLVDLKTGAEIPMPTGFDNFTDSAHHDFVNLPAAVMANRKLLRDVMEKHGFLAFPTEWWHYSLPEPEKYEALDLDFEALKDE